MCAVQSAEEPTSPPCCLYPAGRSLPNKIKGFTISQIVSASERRWHAALWVARGGISGAASWAWALAEAEGRLLHTWSQFLSWDVYSRPPQTHTPSLLCRRFSRSAMSMTTMRSTDVSHRVVGRTQLDPRAVHRLSAALLHTLLQPQDRPPPLPRRASGPTQAAGIADPLRRQTRRDV